MEVEEWWKTGSIHHVSDVRWTQDGCRGCEHCLPCIHSMSLMWWMLLGFFYSSYIRAFWVMWTYIGNIRIPFFAYLISVSVLCLVNVLCKFIAHFSHVGVHAITPCAHVQVGLRNWLVSVCHQRSGELQQIRQFLESSFHSDLTTFLYLIDWKCLAWKSLHF